MRKEGTLRQKRKCFTSKKIRKEGRYKPPNTLDGTTQTDYKVGTDHQKLCDTIQSNFEDEMAVPE